jgi:hypothetical protein
VHPAHLADGRDRRARQLEGSTIQRFVLSAAADQSNLRDIAAWRMLLSAAWSAKASNARRQAPYNPMAENSEKRKPVLPSSIVSARPPVAWAIGSEP